MIISKLKNLSDEDETYREALAIVEKYKKMDLEKGTKSVRFCYEFTEKHVF